MRETMVIHKTEVESTLANMNGKMVSVDWKTKDGRWRTANGRLGVTRYSHGGVNPAADNPALPYVVIWEAPKPQEQRKPGRNRYRNLNIDTIGFIRGGGKDMIVT